MFLGFQEVNPREDNPREDTGRDSIVSSLIREEEVIHKVLDEKAGEDTKARRVDAFLSCNLLS